MDSSTPRRFRRFASASLAALLLASLLPGVVSALPAVTKTPADASISVDTSPAGTNTFIPITGPVFTENAAAGIKTGGNVVLTAPSNWAFQSGSSVTVVKGFSAGAACPLTVTSPVTATASTITITLGGSNSSGADRCTLTFSGIKVHPTATSLPNTDTIAIGYTSTADLGGHTTAGTLTAVPGAPILYFSPGNGGIQPPSTAVSATAFAPQPKVHSEDQFGNERDGDLVNIALIGGPAGAILSGCADVATSGGGDALFAGCKIDKAGSGYQLRATTSGGTAANSSAITITPGTAVKLGFVTQPARGTPGGNFAVQPVVAIQDAQGNTVTTASASDVVLSKTAGPGTLQCTDLSPGTSNGVATYSNCRISSVGVSDQLTASAAGYTDAVSGPFDVSDRLAFTTAPAGAVGGVAFTTQPVVKVQAGAGNNSVNDQATQVALTLSGGTAGAILTCTTNPVTVVNGVATFDGCKIDKTGTYNLTASSLTIPNSAQTQIIVVAGAANKLGFTTQPGGAVVSQPFTMQPVVTVQDVGGNTVTTGAFSTALVTLSINANPGAAVLTCTGGLTKAAFAGVATFAGCMLDKPGVGYTLIATTSVLNAAVSTAFNVAAPTAVISLFTSSPVITWGSSILLTAQFGINGAGKPFSIQVTRDGVNWSTIANLVTNAAGTASFTYRPSENRYYRAVFAGTPDLLAGNSATVRTVVRQIAILRPAPGTTVHQVSRGTAITFNTTVRPNRPELPQASARFLVYQLGPTGWTQVLNRVVLVDRATGVAALQVTFNTVGRFYVRSQAIPTPYNANSVWSGLVLYKVV